jgi:16S rRNA (cytidine1402-2'-O)-methyltransferase
MAEGCLYLVATPIGNLEDITLRALRVLKEVDLIACEDTRHTAKLLTHFGIATPRESYHEHNEEKRAAKLLEQLKHGKSVALVSDAGMPLVSDPGYTLVAECVRERIPVIPIPGPSAVITAISASGLPSDSFFFGGFLPQKSAERRRKIAELSGLPGTLILYEAPHRLLASLTDLAEILGARRACLARELTKIHEEWLRGTLPEILETMKSREAVRGEITLLIDQGDPVVETVIGSGSILGDVEEQMRQGGISTKDALRAVARRRGISRRAAYQKLLEEKSDLLPD